MKKNLISLTLALAFSCVLLIVFSKKMKNTRDVNWSSDLDLTNEEYIGKYKLKAVNGDIDANIGVYNALLEEGKYQQAIPYLKRASNAGIEQASEILKDHGYKEESH